MQSRRQRLSSGLPLQDVLSPVAQEAFPETIMLTDDASELHRLCNMLGKIYDGLPVGSPLREAISKAALGLSFAYTHGGRSAVEAGALGIGAPLDQTQLEYLRSLGLEPEELQ